MTYNVCFLSSYMILYGFLNLYLSYNQLKKTPSFLYLCILKPCLRSAGIKCNFMVSYSVCASLLMINAVPLEKVREVCVKLIITILSQETKGMCVFCFLMNSAYPLKYFFSFCKKSVLVNVTVIGQVCVPLRCFNLLRDTSAFQGSGSW